MAARENAEAAARAAASEAPRFLLDQMLGRLARWLRVLGYDAEWAAGREDAELLRAAEAEDRFLLTRDTLLVCRRAVNQGRVRAYLIRHDHLEDQLQQLREELGLHRIGPPRCLLCNEELLPLQKSLAAGQVPSYVALTQSSFRRCPNCGRIMWPGTHWRAMSEVLARSGYGE